LSLSQIIPPYKKIEPRGSTIQTAKPPCIPFSRGTGETFFYTSRRYKHTPEVAGLLAILLPHRRLPDFLKSHGDPRKISGKLSVRQVYSGGNRAGFSNVSGFPITIRVLVCDVR
jgi:hypothetical protein